MKLTEKKLKQLILETLSQAERDGIMQMIETGDEGNINQALDLLETLGGDLEMAEALMRLPTNTHTLERGWEMFSDLASIPEPKRVHGGTQNMKSAFHSLVYSEEAGEKIVDFLRMRNWKEYSGEGVPDEYDFVYMKPADEVHIMLPFRELAPHDDDDEYGW